MDTLTALVSALLDGTLASDTADTADTIDTDYLTLNDTTFDTTVMRQGTVAMVFFLYAGGMPCQYMDSVVAQLVPFYEGRAIIAKLHAWGDTIEYSIFLDYPNAILSGIADVQLRASRTGNGDGRVYHVSFSLI